MKKRDVSEFDLHQIENDFLLKWNDGAERPQLQSFIVDLDVDQQRQVLEILIPIDIQRRFERGEDARAEDYEQWGLQAAAIALELFEELDQPPRPLADRQTRGGAAERQQADTWKSSLPLATADNLITDRYRLLQKIGQGGMGSVWLAQQEKPMRRRVAIKVIGKSMDGKEALNRFTAERQALALMNHPNIARVLDAGTTEENRPFFAMELVKGIPITQYCSDHRLTLEKRLQLMIPICEAVQHAHQKGIIHRDLKPSNILVEVQEGLPVPKVIDFGLAKALEHSNQLSDETIVTEFGRVVGTLQYMSPEQADSNELDIDTRADVYSLGVILYQLLTDTIPLEKETMTGKSLIQIVELIRDQNVVRPSARLFEEPDQLATAADERQIDPQLLIRHLKGELDWIVLKALQRDRVERYQTAAGLAADLRRYLNDEPVDARPPSKAYLLKKFVRKNRALVLSVLGVTAVLLFSTIFSTFSFFQVQAARELAVHQREQARKQLDVYLNSFRSLDLRAGGNKLMTPSDVLMQARAQIENEDLDARVKADFFHSLGQSLSGFSRYETASELFEQAYRLREQDGDTLGANESLKSQIRCLAEWQKALTPAEKEPLKVMTKMDFLFDRLRREARSEKQEMVAKDFKAKVYFAVFKEQKKKLQLSGRLPNEEIIDESISLFEDYRRYLQDQTSEKNQIERLKTDTNLANAYLKRGHQEDVRQALALYAQVVPKWHEWIAEPSQNARLQRTKIRFRLMAENNYAEALTADGQMAKAIELFQKVNLEKVEHYYLWHEDRRTTLRLLLAALLDAKQFEEARDLISDTRQKIRGEKDKQNEELDQTYERLRDTLGNFEDQITNALVSDDPTNSKDSPAEQ